MPKRILITGASVAGNTIAAVLADYDFEVVVVERAEAFRDGGQNVDVRGVGREVLRRLADCHDRIFKSHVVQQALDRSALPFSATGPDLPIAMGMGLCVSHNDLA